MADPGTFDLKAEVKLSKCDSIPEIRESITLAGLDYSSSCTVPVEKDEDVLVSIQCKYEQLKYLLIKPLKVATEAQLTKTPPEWTDVDKLPDRATLATSLTYSIGDSEKCSLGFAQAFYDGLIALLLSNADECSLTISLRGTEYQKVLVQVVKAGMVGESSTHTTSGTNTGGTSPDCSDEDLDNSEEDAYEADANQGSYDPSDD